MLMEQPKRTGIVLSVLLAVYGISAVQMPRAEAVDVADTSSVTWRTQDAADGTYNFSDGLSFSFEGDNTKGGVYVVSPKNNASSNRVLNALDDLTISQKNQRTYNLSAGAFVNGYLPGFDEFTPAHLTFKGKTVHLNGSYEGTPTLFASQEVYGASVEGEFFSSTDTENTRRATLDFNNSDTYLSASYNPTEKIANGSSVAGLYVRGTAAATFNGNAYISAAMNENADIDSGAAVKVWAGSATFNGYTTELTAANDYNGDRDESAVYGVYLQGHYNGSPVSFTPYDEVIFNSPNTSITVNGTESAAARGIYAHIGNVKISNQVKQFTLTADSGSNASDVYGLYAWNHGTITSDAKTANISVSTKNDSTSYVDNSAAYVYANGHIAINGSELNLSAQGGKSSAAVYAWGSPSNLEAEDDSITLTKGNTIDLNADSMTLTATDKNGAPSFAAIAQADKDWAVININSDNDGNAQGKTLKATGNVYVSGGSEEDAYATINMNLSDTDSFLRGWMDYKNNTGTGTLNLGVENGSTWYMTDSSKVTNLKVSDGGVVDMRADNGAYSTVQANTLSGSGGIFKEDVDVRSMEADRIYVPGNFSGTQALDIYQKDNYVPETNSSEGNGLVLATVNGDGTFTARDREGTLFYTHYDLAHKDSDTEGYETDWYLNRIYQVNPEVKPTPTVDESTASYGLAYYTWRTEIDKLLQRMGELRHNGEDEKGLWVRVKGSKIGHNGKFGFENKYQHYEIGYDDVVKKEKDLTRYQGVSFSYVDGDGTYHNGSGSSHGGALSCYSTDIRSKGHYLDLVFKIGHYNTDYTTYTGSGEKVRGDFDNTGVSLSAEYGRKKMLSDDGWYIEPQTQFSLGYFGGDSYTTSNGVQVRQDGIKSAIGRVGFNLGKDLGPKSKVYFKANWYHDFAGNGGITLTDPEGRAHIDRDYGDTWFTYGIGTAFRMSKNSHFYCDVERSTGSSFHTNWQWNVGMRMNF
ncbi:MAG: autotransporter outer membrane beta-barrel domain-containing protein [Acidaminococcus sp.]|jgi:outer membrane autotransporter protein|nr:autotransporter outer membrane beta-barrel domain-containing protein [Acidaminococcus sp.]MCI2100440.1 autotransporter outer membrane beta-barrel domain-containing protein [Acidaminococcus sp.]MCI2116819.1 autotransporter outer membrane beta-barrel domain-containing protein [Acidaminococcus sp.]